MIYVALLRGINVGGNNKIPMADLRACLENLGYEHVKTYINSGNVIFSSDKAAHKIAAEIETALSKTFILAAGPIKVLIISREQLADVIAGAPKGFGEDPGKYHSDVAFLMGKPASEAIEQFDVHPEVDAVWAGKDVVYYRRLSAKLTKSRLSKIASKPIYKFMTIRTWNTVRKLNDLMQNV